MMTLSHPGSGGEGIGDQGQAHQVETRTVLTFALMLLPNDSLRLMAG